MNHLEMFSQYISLVVIGTIAFYYLGLTFNYVLRHVTNYTKAVFTRIEKHLGN
jgi:flagellar biosynthesis protein FliQ